MYLDTKWESSIVDLIDAGDDKFDGKAVSKYDLREIFAETTGSLVLCLALAWTF